MTKEKALTDEQVKTLLQDIKEKNISQLADEFNVSRQTILNYLRAEFLTVRAALIAKGLDDSEATQEAYKEIYKCQQTVITIER